MIACKFIFLLLFLLLCLWIYSSPEDVTKIKSKSWEVNEGLLSLELLNSYTPNNAILLIVLCTDWTEATIDMRCSFFLSILIYKLPVKNDLNILHFDIQIYLKVRPLSVAWSFYKIRFSISVPQLTNSALHHRAVVICDQECSHHHQSPIAGRQIFA